MLKTKVINKETPIPMYYQLKQIILEEIETGEYKPGSAIPTEQELIQMYGISRTTVRQALSELVHEGVLYRVKSQGTFVADHKMTQGFIQNLTSFDEEMKQLGFIPSTEVLTFEVVGVPEIMGHLMPDNKIKDVIHLERLRKANGNPIVHLDTYLPYDRCQRILDVDFTKDSLYDVLSKSKETKVYKATRICRADISNTKDSQLLCIKKGAPIHSFESAGYNEKGELIEYSVARYRGDCNEFKVDVYPR